MKKIITLEKDDIKNIVTETLKEIKEQNSLLLEMPYSRNDYIVIVDANARNAYIHFGKLFLYKNTTQNANSWINEIVNKFTVPMLTAKVHVGDNAKAKVLINGYIVNFFGENYEDYMEQMEDFCSQSIYEMESHAQINGMAIPEHDEIKETIEKGEEIIIAYGNAIKDILKNGDEVEAKQTLQEIIRGEVDKVFGLGV